MDKIEHGVYSLKKTGSLVYVVAAGAGNHIMPSLARVPGLSSTLLGHETLYSSAMMDDFLGGKPDGYCSQKTAWRLAAIGWRKARRLAILAGKNPDKAVCLAITGVIGTDRVLRGDHRSHIATRDNQTFASLCVTFMKDAQGRSLFGREREDQLASDMSLDLLLYPGSTLSCASNPQVTLRTVMPAGDSQDTEIAAPDPERHVLYPGTFNPLHHGHERLSRMAAEQTGKTVVYMLCDKHPDKGEVPAYVAGQFAHAYPWTRSSEPLFVDKMRAYPGFTWLMGDDSYLRILDPQYGVSVGDIASIVAETESKILVASRNGLPHDSRLFEVPNTCILTGADPCSSTKVRELSAEQP